MDLWTEERIQKRDRLLDLGWTMVSLNDTTWWRMPRSDVVLTEKEAFLWLEAHTST